MKKAIQSFITRLGLVLFVLIFSFKGLAQTQFTMSIASVTSTANTIDITLTVTATNPSEGIRFGGFQAGINFSTTIINGGTISATYVGGRSAALSGLAANVINVATAGHLRLAPSSLTGVQGVDMLQGTSLTLGTYRISNTANWTTSSNADLWLQNVQFSGKTNSAVGGYPYGQPTPLFSYTTTAPASPPGLILSHTSTSTQTVLLNSVSGPTASVLSGDATICAGTSTNISVAVTGGVSPYTVTVTDGTNNYSATGASPVSIAVSPTSTSTYSIVSVTGGGTGTGNTGSATVTVTPNVTPTFTAVSAICSGGSLSALPTSSTNTTPITGTWSPALNNTATTTYTFTPTAGQCATTTTLSITVTPATTTGSVDTSICAGASYVWPANGQTYTSAQLGLTVITGCNTATLNLTITPVTTTGSVDTSICALASYTWPANGVTYTAAQTNLIVVTGCNTATLNLTLTPVQDNTLNVDTIANSYTWIVNGQTYITSGTYNFVDSINCVNEILILSLTNDIAEESSDAFTIFPNPTNGNVVISLFSDDQCRLNVYDSQGQLVFENPSISNGEEVNLSDYSPGVYIFRVYTYNQIYTRRIIKN